MLQYSLYHALTAPSEIIWPLSFLSGSRIFDMLWRYQNALILWCCYMKSEISFETNILPSSGNRLRVVVNIIFSVSGLTFYRYWRSGQSCDCSRLRQRLMKRINVNQLKVNYRGLSFERCFKRCITTVYSAFDYRTQWSPKKLSLEIGAGPLGDNANFYVTPEEERQRRFHQRRT